MKKEKKNLNDWPIEKSIQSAIVVGRDALITNRFDLGRAVIAPNSNIIENACANHSQPLAEGPRLPVLGWMYVLRIHIPDDHNMEQEIDALANENDEKYIIDNKCSRRWEGGSLKGCICISDERQNSKVQIGI